MKVITIIVVSLAVGVGSTAGYYQNKLNDQTEQTKQADSKVQQLKDQDEKLFNYYRDGINLAIDVIECENKVDCLDNKADRLDIIGPKVKTELNNRRDLVGAEKY